MENKEDAEVLFGVINELSENQKTAQDESKKEQEFKKLDIKEKRKKLKEKHVAKKKSKAEAAVMAASSDASKAKPVTNSSPDQSSVLIEELKQQSKDEDGKTDKTK